MTSSNIGVKHYAQDFVYQLCEENGDRMVSWLGYGACAGFLAENPEGLQDFVKNVASQVQDDKEKQGPSLVEPVESNDDEEIDEEKERELTELMLKIERLNELGIITTKKK